MLNLQTGFGNPDTQDFVYFNHLVSDATQLTPDWHAELNSVEDPIVGSSDVEIQLLGFGSARMEARLLFHKREDFYRLQAMVGRKASLVLLNNWTRQRGEVFHRLGHDYVRHDNVLLLDLVPQFRTGGTLAVATFVASTSGLGVQQW